ncbi:TolA-binding protein [Rhizobium ruizarguesonis]
MKSAHKAFVTKATPVRKAIDAERAKVEELQDQMDAANEEIATLSSELSVIEQEAADAGLSTADLHAAIKD